MKRAMTLEQLLTKTADGILLDIQEELISKVVPKTGYSHTFIRKVNRMIDQGELCINENTYRRVYLPTFARSVSKELARRYTELLKKQIYTTTVKNGNSCEQMTLDLVKINEQAEMEDPR